MSEATHSPGPWRFNPDPRFGWNVSPNGSDGVIATLTVYATGDAEFPDAVQHANGYLMSAAPDLLAACEAVLAAWADPNALDARVEALRAARTAVAKAKGEAP